MIKQNFFLSLVKYLLKFSYCLTFRFSLENMFSLQDCMDKILFFSNRPIFEAFGESKSAIANKTLFLYSILLLLENFAYSIE